MKSSPSYVKEVKEAFKSIQCLSHSAFSMTMINDILCYAINISN